MVEDKLILLNKIFENAKENHLENKRTQNMKNKKPKQEERNKIISGLDYNKDCCSKELLNLIKNFNFTIKKYEKMNPNIVYSDEELVNDIYIPEKIILSEKYYCSFNNWEFSIENYKKANITQGVFMIGYLQHKITKETVDIHCDLGGRLTSLKIRDLFLEFLKYDTLSDFVNVKYKKYVDIPILLREKGYNVTPIDYTFGIGEGKGYIKIEDNIYIKPHKNSDDDIIFVITNDIHWSNYEIVFGANLTSKKAYYFDYKEEDFIDELCKCIEAFKEHLDGKIGYYENGRYYNTENIVKFYDSLRNKENYYSEAWNHGLIQIDYTDDLDLNNLDKLINMMPNKYTGLEIYHKASVILNDAAQWSIGDISNKSVITFEYDKRKSDKCHLIIENYTYDNSILHFNHNDEGCPLSRDEKHIDTVEFYGAFTEMIEILSYYINKMCEMHEIVLN